MTYSSADQSRIANKNAMGENLGEYYSELWQELAFINFKWQEYVDLFGTNPERIDLLNRASPTFFKMIQDELWDSILLSIARITDTPEMGKRKNLTVKGLPQLVEFEIRKAVGSKLDLAIDATSFCRDLRNRRLAHRDLQSALKKSATPLQGATREQVRNGLGAIADSAKYYTIALS